MPHGYIILADGRSEPTVKTRGGITVFLTVLITLLVILAAATWLMMRNDSDIASGPQREAGAATVRERTLDEAKEARFVSIFVSDPAGGLASYMVGGSTDEFNEFAAAITNAQPVPGASDATFSDLLVFSFASNDTLELPYSPTRNQYLYSDRLYQPTTDLAPMIARVEQKFQT